MGGFLGLRSGRTDYTFTNTDGKQVTLGAFDGCSVEGEIIGSTGTFGGFIAESRAYSGQSIPDVAYRNAVSDVDITASANAVAGGFVASLNTTAAGQNIPHSFDNCAALGTIKLGSSAPVGAPFIASATTNASAGITLEDCFTSAFEDLDLEALDEAWKQASANTQLDEAAWKWAQDIVLSQLIKNQPGNLTIPVPSFTITFDTNGGTPVRPITQPFATAVTAPADPTRDGYLFDGWDTAIPAFMTRDITITALWTANPGVAAGQGELPATGDSSSFAPWLFLLTACAAAALLRRRRAA